jgi:uncharacterized protein
LQRIPSLYVAPSPLGGRGVFSALPIEEGSLIEICPVIVLKAEDREWIEKTDLYNYYFFWGENEKENAVALGYGSLYNHSFQPNAHYFPDFEGRTITFEALCDIEAGEEITVNYNGDPDVQTPVWFQAKKKMPR